MHKSLTLTWQQLVFLVSPDLLPMKLKDISSVVTFSRLNGIGRPLTYQKTIYDERDLKTLRTIFEWWVIINKFAIPEYRNSETTESLVKRVCTAILQSKKLAVYAVFCPSYKTGKGAYGYTGIIGNHTKKYIKKFCNFISESKKAGLQIHAVAYFSDLLLENFERLRGTNYKKDLKKNFKSFLEEFGKLQQHGEIEVKKLSGISEAKSQIGEKGITQGELGIHERLFSRVYKRNIAFYHHELGWTKGMVKKRTEILARSYSCLGQILKMKHPNGVMVFVESAYERGDMFSGDSNTDPIPIIYPRKDRQ